MKQVTTRTKLICGMLVVVIAGAYYFFFNDNGLDFQCALVERAARAERPGSVAYSRVLAHWLAMSGNPRKQEYAAEILLRTGWQDMYAARQLLTHAIDKHPDGVSYYRRGNIYMMRGAYTNAIADYEQALRFRGNNFDLSPITISNALARATRCATAEEKAKGAMQ